jgi:4-hydroxy-4-methyl-2-oxoglutarate aldolase
VTFLYGDERGVLHIPDESLPGSFEEAGAIREEEQRVVEWSPSADLTVQGLLALRRVRHQRPQSLSGGA